MLIFLQGRKHRLGNGEDFFDIFSQNNTLKTFINQNSSCCYFELNTLPAIYLVFLLKCLFSSHFIINFHLCCCFVSKGVIWVAVGDCVSPDASAAMTPMRCGMDGKDCTVLSKPGTEGLPKCLEKTQHQKQMQTNSQLV